MLKLDVNKEKQLKFEIQIDGGVQTDQVSSRLRIEIDNIEYGFPAYVRRESITVDLPALKSVTARKLKEGEKVDVKLEIIADGHYLTPWNDTFTLSNPLVVEAKIIDTDFKTDPVVETKLVQTSASETGNQKQGGVAEASIKEEIKEAPKPKKVAKVDVKNITEEGVYQYMERAGTKNETIQKLIYEQAEQAAGSSKPVEVLRQVVKLLKSKK